MNTTKAMVQLKAAATIIAISHLHYKESTRIPQSPKPTMLPRSPFADQIPMALPSLFRSKCSLVRVNKVGQAGNWKKPKTRSPIEGSTCFVKKLSATEEPQMRDVMGITR